MENSDNAAALAEIQRLERLIQNCRHGGPAPADHPWFQQSMALAETQIPLDTLIDTSTVDNNDHNIRTALVVAINTLVDHFRSALAEIGSKKVFASMAVDAWLGEDFKFVRKFLIRSIILEHFQNHGASNSIQEINQTTDENTEGCILLRRIQGVLQSHDAGLKHILKQCTDTSCLCIELAETVNEEKEVLSNPNIDMETILARRKEKELPPILSASSKYWVVKKKAANAFKRGKLDESKKLYLQAKSMLEEHRDLNKNIPTHQVDWAFQIGDELGKIACNLLSMICLRQNLKEEALQNADTACLACPGRYKSFCRRSLALIWPLED